MAKFFTIQSDQIRQIEKLIHNARDNEYVVLQQSNGFSDIAQWSDKYQCVKVITVPTDRLDWTQRLA